MAGPELCALYEPFIQNHLWATGLGAIWMGLKSAFCVKHSSKTTCLGTVMGAMWRGPKIGVLLQAFIHNILFGCRPGSDVGRGSMSPAESPRRAYKSIIRMTSGNHVALGACFDAVSASAWGWWRAPNFVVCVRH